MSGALISVFANQRGFAVVPGAPTIGTATTTGSTTATVAFTAPASDGGSTITSYTATSSPGGITGTLNQAGSGTISITGLTGGTSYTFTVTATNAVGTGPASAASNSITTVPVIGQAYGGGFFAGKISTSADGNATHYLVVSDASVGQTTGKQWGPMGVTTGYSSRIAGPTNSAGLAALGASYQAATFCEGLNTGGYTDWYMPAQNEVKVLYYFLKPDTGANNTGFGANPNAVSPEPYNTPHTSGNPAQTSATNFRTGASSQEFTTSAALWTSTESDTNSNDYAWRTFFDDGREFDYPKTATTFYIRAIRRVAV